MKIRKFKIKDTLLLETQLPAVFKAANIFGAHYLIEYVISIINNITCLNQNEKQQILINLSNLYANKQIIYWRNNVISEQLFNIVGPLKTLTGQYYLLNLLEAFLLELSASKFLFLPRFQLELSHDFTDFTYKKIDYLDFKKLEKLFYKRFNYIYVKDKSHWGNNWYSLEFYTRGKNKMKYVVPFYRNISREVINFHIALELNMINEDIVQKIRLHPSIYYMPPSGWDTDIKDIIMPIRQRIQRNKLFKIENNYQIINNTYYIYNYNLIDIDFNLYKLNIKWLKEAEIIRASKKTNKYAKSSL